VWGDGKPRPPFSLETLGAQPTPRSGKSGRGGPVVERNRTPRSWGSKTPLVKGTTLTSDPRKLFLLLLGVICFALLLPLGYGNVPPELWYGIRLGAPFRSPEHRRRINRFGPKLTLRGSWSLMAVPQVLAVPLPWSPVLRTVRALAYQLKVFVPLRLIMRLAKSLPPELSRCEGGTTTGGNVAAEKPNKVFGVGFSVVPETVMLTALPVECGLTPANQIYAIRFPAASRSPGDWERLEVGTFARGLGPLCPLG